MHLWKTGKYHCFKGCPLHINHSSVCFPILIGWPFESYGQELEFWTCRLVEDLKSIHVLAITLLKSREPKMEIWEEEFPVESSFSQVIENQIDMCKIQIHLSVNPWKGSGFIEYERKRRSKKCVMFPTGHFCAIISLSFHYLSLITALSC